MSVLDDIVDREMRELRLDTRGHRVLHTEIERVDDKNYADEWGGHTYFVKWTNITAKFMVETFKKDGNTFLHGVDGRLPYSCGNCDEWMSYDLVGDFAVAKTECQYPNGMTTVVEIDVLSGRLICDDDLRDAEGFDIDIDEGASYNSTLGQAQVVEASAAVGLAYAPVGNSSPSLYSAKPGKYAIANAGYDEDLNMSLELYIEGHEAVPVAGFCTDLWAASMADYETYLAAGGKPIEDEDQNGTRSVIDVPPGRYRLTYHGGEAGFEDDYAAGAVYAEFERIA